MDRFTELQTFVAIVEAGSLAAAARRLHRSPPAVTRILSDLEARIGIPLILRNSRSSLPTEAGRRFADQARRLLAEYQEALAEASGEATTPAGPLRMTAPLVFGCRHVAPLVTRFLATNRRISVELRLADRLADLHDESFDLAVRIGGSVDRTLECLPVGQVRRLVVASPAYLQRCGEPLSPEEIQDHETIQQATPADDPPWVFRDPSGRPCIVATSSRFAVNHADAAIAAARAGHGLVRVLSYQVHEELKEGSLLRLLQRWEPDPLPVRLVLPQQRRRVQRLDILVKYLSETLSHLPALSKD